MKTLTERVHRELTSALAGLRTMSVGSLDWQTIAHRVASHLGPPTTYFGDHDEFVNELLSQAPEDWDGDEAMEGIALDYVRRLEKLLDDRGISRHRNSPLDEPETGWPRALPWSHQMGADLTNLPMLAGHREGEPGQVVCGERWTDTRSRTWSCTRMVDRDEPHKGLPHAAGGGAGRIFAEWSAPELAPLRADG